MPQAYVETNEKAEALSEGGGRRITISTTDTTVAAATSGDIVVYNGLVGVAITDYDDTNETITLEISGGHTVEVVAVDDSGNSAVEVGDWLYYDKANSRISKESSGNQAVGIARSTLATGTTGDVDVQFIPQAP